MEKRGIEPCFHKWFGKDKFLKSLNISLTADTQTELSADRTWEGLRERDGEIYTQ